VSLLPTLVLLNVIGLPFIQIAASMSLEYRIAKHQVSKEAIIEFVGELKFPMTLFYNRKFNFPFSGYHLSGDDYLDWLTSRSRKNATIAWWGVIGFFSVCLAILAIVVFRDLGSDNATWEAIMFCVFSIELFLTLRFGRKLKDIEERLQNEKKMQE
jgi:hypothetical protein